MSSYDTPEWRLVDELSEDLMVNYSRIRTVQGVPAIATAVVGNSINTVGSSVTRSNFWKMRDAAASAREMLVQAAMNSLNDQNRANFTADKGVVTQTSTGVRKTYGQLATLAAGLPVP